MGAFTVTACKGLAAGLKELFTRQYSHSIWIVFLCAITIIVCVLIQMIYLNRALDLFTTPIVTTVYYVLFTTCVLTTSSILFREWHLLTLIDIIACLVGFSITICGLILINYMKTNRLSNGIQSIVMNGIFLQINETNIIVFIIINCRYISFFFSSFVFSPIIIKFIVNYFHQTTTTFPTSKI